MSTPLEIRVGDTARTIDDVLEINRQPIDLTGATVRILLRPIGSARVAKTASVVSASEGSVSYQPSSSDFLEPGEVFFAWHITFPDSKTLTVPTEHNHRLKVIPK